MPPHIKPPFTAETARAKVKAAEGAWNSRDPERVALAYTPDSEWRNRAEFFKGRDAIKEFLRRKWSKELDYRLMKEFKRQTGCSVIINTSFNIRGEPIVCTPQDAYRCLVNTDMDVLVLENCVLFRADQPAIDPEIRKKYMESFKLD